MYRQKYYQAFHLNFKSRIPEFIDLYRKYRPSSLDGYSQSIYSIARYLKENAIRIDKCRFVLGTAENLFPYQKNEIEEYLGPFSDLYGFGEINGIALKPAGTDKYVVLDSRVCLESFPGSQMDTHEILVTDLFNKILPFIRYQPGDLFTGMNGKNEQYPQFNSFSGLEGRTANIIELPNGKAVHPVNLLGGTFFRNHLELKKHKVTWDGATLHFIFETSGEYSETNILASLAEYLRQYEVPFTLSFADHIPAGTSGKFNYFENLNSAADPPNK
jgi:phenylacetate-CoA ligase